VWQLGLSDTPITLAARYLEAPFESYLAQGISNGVRYRGYITPSSNPEIGWSYVLVGPQTSPFPYGEDVESDT